MRQALTALTFSFLAIAISACNQGGKSNDSSTTANSGQKAAVASAGPKAQSACDLLAPGEIAGFLKVAAVKKDATNSGKNDMTKVDFCNWYVKEGSSEGIEIRLRRADAVDGGSEMALFSAAKGDAVEHDAERSQKAESLSGVGDEAIYSPYPDGKGGNIAMRVGSSAVTLTASASRDALISMARLAATRM